MMTLTSLQKDLEEYPERLKQALIRQLKAGTALKAVQEEVEQSNVDSDVEEDEQEPASSSDYEKLQVRYAQKKAQLELEVRRNPPDGIKITESTVDALLNANEELCKMKEQMIDLQRKRVENTRTLRSRRTRTEPRTSDAKLMQKLIKAEEESKNAYIEVEVLRETLETYKMLTVILTDQN
jgi:hypothetical protein